MTGSLRGRGMVSLVGAGPGDPELITLRGLRCLQAAEVVVFDRLIDPRLLDEVPRDAERIFVGKALGFAVMDQRSIEDVLIDRARSGKYVVRLKGGDPFVFGRGGEEVEALTSAGVDYEIVPGISSAIAVPASAGIPVTHRDLSSTVTVITGHEDPSKPESSVDWRWLAQSSGTLVILMGLERLDAICTRLLAEGCHPCTPAAAVSSGTLPNQRTVTSTLERLPSTVKHAQLRSPAVIVIGEVAAFPDTLASLQTAALAQAV